MKKTFLFVMLALFIMANFVMPALADPFSDVPEDHWSYDAVQMLEEKGLVEGYPDGLFKGDRPMTRYEMAMVVARVIAKLEQVQASIPEIPDLSIYATKQDLETLNALLDEFRSELDALGVRVVNIEDSLGKLTSRVEELERITLSGNFNTTAVGIGLYPGDNNTTSTGNASGLNAGFDQIANPIGGPAGPSTIYGSDQFLGGFRLYEGYAVMSNLNLNIAAKVSDGIKAGGYLQAYSTFGEPGISDMWGLVPPYNSTGRQATDTMHFQANLSTLWFDTDGDWDITGKYGDYTISKVSKNLFVGPRALFAYGGAIKLPLNGLNFVGTLYDTVDFEVFEANNINAIQGFLNPDPFGGVTSTNPYFYGASDHRHPLSNPTYYPLAVPYNNGAGSSHFLGYGQVDRGMYDNTLYGFWAGHDFLEDKAHIEGAYLRVQENFASNPNVNIVGVAPKGTTYYGLNGYYIFGEDTKVKIYGEFNQTVFDYNLLDRNVDTYSGNLFDFGAEVSLSEDTIKIFGKYIRVDPNYDPFGFHRTWEKEYGDGLHPMQCCKDWKFGLCANATRIGEFRPNRTGVDLGVDWFFGDDKQGHFYGDFTYLTQIDPTQITGDEESFQKYDTTNPLYYNGYDPAGFVASTIGANIYGNQDLAFSVNDPATGNVYMMEFGGHYTFGDNIHVWGNYERYKYNREFTNAHQNAAGVTFTQQDYAYNFFYTGLTYDVTDKFSVQGNFAYANNTGERSGSQIDWSQIIPGCGIKYSFNKSTHFLVDYKYYSYSDDASAIAGANDYSANKIMTRLVVNF